MTRAQARLRRTRPNGATPNRLVALLVVWVLACLALLARMVDLQVVRGGALERLALRQQMEAVDIPGRRGVILDRAGRPLAINVEVDSIYAVPRAITDPRAFARRVAPVLGVTPAEVVARLGRGGRYFAWLARRQPVAVAKALAGLGLGGKIGVVPEAQRDYPNGPLAASVIGFAGTDDRGLAGLELQYNDLLQGASGAGTANRDAIGRELMQTLQILTPPRDGDTVVLTLDAVIQHIAERELANAVRQAHALGGVAIVMDPQTGAILALASTPSFDPNVYEHSPPSLWKSAAVSNVYEPGSTFKLILATAATASGAFTRDDRVTDPGQIHINGVTIHDAERSEHFASLSLSEIIKYSSNVGAAQIATRVGKATYARYIRAFGFGRPTGIDLPGEASGLVRPIGQWFGPTLQNIGFGQGISVTPIQLLVAESALATGGIEVRPHLLGSVRDGEGRPLAPPDGPQPHRVVPAGVAAQVFAMMRGVLTDGGTGVKARIPGFTVAGKTGTAQKPSPHGGYESGGYIASFVGVVPATDPRLAMLVVIDHPQGLYYGGDVAAPVFREIGRQVLWYLQIPPSAPPADSDAASEAPAPPAAARAAAR